MSQGWLNILKSVGSSNKFLVFYYEKLNFYELLIKFVWATSSSPILPQCHL